MSHAVFGAVYADQYDLFYQEKDYAAECDVIERVFGAHGAGAVRRVLDLGCGTGNHSIPLGQRGYEVLGVDRSEAMLAHAQRKAAEIGEAPVRFTRADITTYRGEERFDAALMMFAVLGYQLENAAVLGALASARHGLRPGALLIFDVWYGPAVLTQRPAERLKVYQVPGGQVLRAASGVLDSAHDVCTVNLEVWRLQGDRVADHTAESHQMRYFFPGELELFLSVSGFSLVHLSAFPELDRPADESTWNVLGVARAV